MSSSPSPSVGRTAGARLVMDSGYTLLLTALIWMIFLQNWPESLQGYDIQFDADNFKAPNSLDRVLKLTMLGVGAFMILVRLRLAVAIARSNWGLWPIFALAILSTLWSIAPAQTLLRFISLAALVLACFAFSLGAWHPRRFQQVLVPPLMVILCGTLVLGVVAPTLVIEKANTLALKDAWHGLTHGKNELGMIASVSFIICAQHLLASRRFRLPATIAAATSFACLILSRSNTSLFATIVAVGTLYVLIRRRGLTRRGSARFVGWVSAIILLYEVSIQRLIPGLDFLTAPITALTGKDNTFSARTTIWQVIKQHIALHPVLGTGYGGYWIGPTPESPSYIFLSVLWLYPTESHNGYLEIINDLGYFGLCCMFLFIAIYLRNCLRLMTVDRPQGALFIALMFHQMVMNLSESDFLSRSNTFVILLLASFCAARALVDDRETKRSNPGPLGLAIRPQLAGGSFTS